MSILKYNNNTDVNNIIEQLAQPRARRKHKATQRKEYFMVKTGRPMFNHTGIHNPIKLNISASTLDKLKK